MKQMLALTFTVYGEVMALYSPMANIVKTEEDGIQILSLALYDDGKNSTLINRLFEGSLTTYVKSFNVRGKNTPYLDENLGNISFRYGEFIELKVKQDMGELDGRYRFFVNTRLYPKMISVELEDGHSTNVRTVKDLSKTAKQKLGEEIVNKLRYGYPYPLEENFLEFLTTLLINDNNCKIVNRIGGSSPTATFLFDLDVEHGLETVCMSMGMRDFKQRFNFVPMVLDACLMIDPKRFSRDTFTEFLSYFGGRDKFLSIQKDLRRHYIYAYEVFGSKFQEIDSLLKQNGISLGAINSKDAAIKLFKGKDINSDLIVRAVTATVNQLIQKDQSDFILFAVNALLSNLTKIDNLSELVKKPSALVDTLTQFQYECPAGAEIMVPEMAYLWMNQDTANDYFRLYLKSSEKFLTQPRSIPETLLTAKDKRYTAQFITSEDPRAYTAGIHTNCCQHLHGAGSSCVKYLASHPETSGVFIVMKDGKIIAQSFLWFDRRSGVVCLDNIEVKGREMRDSIWELYLAFADLLAKYKNIFGYTMLTVGLGYNDLREIESLDNVPNSQRVLLSDLPGGNSVYSDAHSQKIIKKF